MVYPNHKQLVASWKNSRAGFRQFLKVLFKNTILGFLINPQLLSFRNWQSALATSLPILPHPPPNPITPHPNPPGPSLSDPHTSISFVEVCTWLMCVCACVYIYTYAKRGKERKQEREKTTEREGERERDWETERDWERKKINTDEANCTRIRNTLGVAPESWFLTSRCTLYLCPRCVGNVKSMPTRPAHPRYVCLNKKDAFGFPMYTCSLNRVADCKVISKLFQKSRYVSQYLKSHQITNKNRKFIPTLQKLIKVPERRANSLCARVCGGRYVGWCVREHEMLEPISLGHGCVVVLL